MTNGERIQQCWAGLLAASLIEGSDDQENLGFVALLSKLERLHVRILASAGQRAIQAEWRPETSSRQGLHCTVEEAKILAGTTDVARIACALDRLYELGLLELTVKPFGFAALDQANLTLTKRGLMFFARCAGRTGLPEAIARNSAELAS